MPKLTIGMASYNNRSEVWFTVQALRMYQDMTDVEILVVDNYGDDKLKGFVEGAASGEARYIRYTEKRGTAAPRDMIFQEAAGEWVFCIDPHVLVAKGAIERLKEWTAANTGCMDLLQGPLRYDDLKNHADALNDTWGNGMWGVWRGATVNPDAPAYQIPMQGLGLFGCRKDAWLGFNPEFSGFGGEEGYIHEKYRKKGRKVLCLPFLSWVHKFKDCTDDVTYPCDYEDRVRNYAIGLQEIGVDLKPMIAHFGRDRIEPYLNKGKTMNIEIVSAVYGGWDVTQQLRKFIRPNGMNVLINNALLGFDPCHGVLKSLEVAYRVDGKDYNKVVEEHACFAVRQHSSKLGIFYSNNNNDKVNSCVVQNLAKIAEGRADILTCSWRPIPANPFPEITAMTQSGNHLNIALQILQLLYRAQDSGDYEYVSFLEHDVMYAEGYFDYPDFEDAVLYNTNLVGICPSGFQTYGHVHDSIPLHQMTMRFKDAIEWFEGCVKKAMKYGQIMLEPELKRMPWTAANPSVHINHGHNFTSHYTLYSKETTQNDPYWGDASELDLF